MILHGATRHEAVDPSDGTSNRLPVFFWDCTYGANLVEAEFFDHRGGKGRNDLAARCAVTPSGNFSSRREGSAFFQSF